MVGAGTALADDPALRTGSRARAQPYRVIVDSRGRLPLNAQVLNDTTVAHTIVATTRRCPEARRRRYAAQGATVWVLPESREGVSLPRLLRALHGRGCLHVLCEGGGVLAAALVRSRLVDEYLLFVAPRILGGRAVPAIGGAGWPLAAAPALAFQECSRLGQDLLIRAQPLHETKQRRRKAGG